jgi:hypothetical protein
MDELDFNNYFDKDKEELKFLLTETGIKVQELKELFDLDTTQKNTKLQLDTEMERYRALKLALIACDDNSVLSTVDFDSYGTLDVNKVYGKCREKFKFNFHKPSLSGPLASITPPATPKQKRI